MGEIDFDLPTSEFFRREVQAPWFAHYLKDEEDHGLPGALIFQSGSNQWSEFDAWPPKRNVEMRKLYLRESDGLSFEVPADEADVFDEYVSDPARPVPYSRRPIQGFWQGGGALWKVEDQRFAHMRPDVLSYETPPLEEDVVIAGRIVANLVASTSGTDCDWIVKLIDVYPEEHPDKPEMGGYQLMIADEVFRARFRNGFERPEPTVPGAPTDYAIDLGSRHHAFKKGHKIMVQIQSMWFPLIDRNPQKYVHVPLAIESDYRRATQRIYRSRNLPSHIELPVLGPR